MSPPSRKPSQKPKEAPSKSATISIEVVQPGPRKPKAGGIVFPREVVEQLANFIKSGQYAGDGQTYDTRQKANTRITRLKRALIYYSFYSEAKEIKSRVWETDDGKFRLGLTDAKAATSSK